MRCEAIRSAEIDGKEIGGFQEVGVVDVEEQFADIYGLGSHGPGGVDCSNPVSHLPFVTGGILHERVEIPRLGLSQLLDKYLVSDLELP